MSNYSYVGWKQKFVSKIFQKHISLMSLTLSEIDIDRGRKVVVHLHAFFSRSNIKFANSYPSSIRTKMVLSGLLLMKNVLYLLKKSFFPGKYLFPISSTLHNGIFCLQYIHYQCCY